MGTHDDSGSAPRKRVGIDLRPLAESRTFRFIWFGSLVSGIGTRFTSIAMVWQVKDLTHGNAGKLALIGLCYAVPLLVLSTFGGAIADQHDRRTILVASNLVGILTSATLAFNAFSDHPRLWLIYVMAVCKATQAAMT
jgi:MFS family permease